MSGVFKADKLLIEVAEKYFPGQEIASVIPIISGHINKTYKIDLKDMGQSYILQCINSDVFTDPFSIAETHCRLQKIIPRQGKSYTIARIIANSEGSYITCDSDGNAWRMTNFIFDSFSVDLIGEKWQALEAGRAFGWFAGLCSQLDVKDFKEAIRDFHSLSFRRRQFREATKQDLAGRSEKARDMISFYAKRETELNIIESLIENGKIPIRIIHNDTKISNLLFRENKAVAVIDLDTVGPGSIIYDYGDALRTSANLAREDEKDLSLVGFNMEAFIAFTEGYLSQLRSVLTSEELEYLYLAPKFMTFIMGIRFLTDYLNGDKYYRTEYPEHNLVRCMVQLKLIESMESREKEMKAIISEKYYRY
jgi:serine/threonine protein kinase